MQCIDRHEAFLCQGLVARLLLVWWKLRQLYQAGHQVWRAETITHFKFKALGLITGDNPRKQLEGRRVITSASRIPLLYINYQVQNQHPSVRLSYAGFRIAFVGITCPRYQQC